MKILWKEWQQQKWFFITGCFAGIIFPAFKILNFKSSNIGGGEVAIFGAIFAIILAAATTHHDTNTGTDNFLKSKPLRIEKIFVTKVLLGAILLYAAFLFVTCLDFITIGYESWPILCYTYPIALLLFALTMFLMVVTRDSSKAVLMAIWAGLGIYFLPLLVGSLGWMNLFEKFNDTIHDVSLIQYISWNMSLPEKLEGSIYRAANIPNNSLSFWQGFIKLVTSAVYLQFLFFVLVMAAGTIVFTVVSIKAMKRNWLWRPGQKSIVWSMGLSGAFVFAIAMFQSGANLDLVKTIAGREIRNPANFRWDKGTSGLGDIFSGGQAFLPDSFSNYNYNPVCTKDDFLFMLYCAIGLDYSKEPVNFDEKVAKHFVLKSVRFPYKVMQSQKTGCNILRLFTGKNVIRRIEQQTFGCFVKGNYLYVAYRPIEFKNSNIKENLPIRFAVVDISKPERPFLIDTIEIEGKKAFFQAFANYGDYCYLSDGFELMIISVANAGKPEVVRRIPYCQLVKQNKYYDLEDAYLQVRNLTVVEGKLLCNDDRKIAILDLNEPSKPKIIFHETFDKRPAHIFGTIKAVAMRGDYLYISNDNGLYVRRIYKNDEGKYLSELVGQRTATPIERFADRVPNKLMFFKGYLVESAGGFGLLVYDVSNPQRPRRVYHSSMDYSNNIMIWKDLIYMQGNDFKATFFDIPEKNN